MEGWEGGGGRGKDGPRGDKALYVMTLNGGIHICISFINPANLHLHSKNISILFIFVNYDYEKAMLKNLIYHR